MKKYIKTLEDEAREKNDLAKNPIMRFMSQQNKQKFNIGDVLLKQTSRPWVQDGEEREWTTAVHLVGAPRKFVYVFENHLGIGYLRQLKADGSGFVRGLQCMANFDPGTVRYVLDPDYIDHMMLSDAGEDFEYNKGYKELKAFRDEAMKKNLKMLVKLGGVRKVNEWFNAIEVGDEFWWGETIEQMIQNKWRVVNISDNPVDQMPEHARHNIPDHHMKWVSKYRYIEVQGNDDDGQWLSYTKTLALSAFARGAKVSMTQPFPLSDELCGPQK